MAHISFGSILRSERERKGYEIVSVARRLRIRPDILQALEETDFSRMPPRGYARNMVHAYARFLGLDPSEITNLYLEEVYAEEVRKARSDRTRHNPNASSEGASRRRSTQDRKGRVDDSIGEINSQGRITMTHRNTNVYTRSDYGGYGADFRTRPARSSVLGSQYKNLYADSPGIGFFRSKLPLIIAGAVILILVIVLLVVLFSPKPDTSGDVQKLPVTGVDNTTQNPGDGSSNENDAQTRPVAPTRAVFEYSVTSDQSAYIEIYVDGAIDVAETISGPSKGSYDVTTTLEFVTTNPQAVKLTVDGVEVQPTDPNGIGVYSMTVDFPAILAQWNTEHPAANSETPSNDSAVSQEDASSADSEEDVIE